MPRSTGASATADGGRTRFVAGRLPRAQLSCHASSPSMPFPRWQEQHDSFPAELVARNFLSRILQDEDRLRVDCATNKGAWRL